MLKQASFAILLLMLASSASASDWPQYLGNQERTCYSSEPATNYQQYGLKWRTATSGFQLLGSPVVANNQVYIRSILPNKVTAYSITGGLAWTFDDGSVYGISHPAVSGGRVYIASTQLYALNELDGSTIWVTQLNSSCVNSAPIELLLADNGILYTSDCNGGVFAVYTNGTKAWEVINLTSAYPNLAYSNGVLYVSSTNISSLNASTGALIWNCTTCSSRNSYEGGIKVDASQIYVVYNGSINARYLNGTLAWASPMTNLTGFALTPSRILAIGPSHTVYRTAYSHNLINGSIDWQNEIGIAPTSPGYSFILPLANNVYVSQYQQASDNYLAFGDIATGTISQTTNLSSLLGNSPKGRITSMPVISGDTLYFGTYYPDSISAFGYTPGGGGGGGGGDEEPPVCAFNSPCCPTAPATPPCDWFCQLNIPGTGNQTAPTPVIIGKIESPTLGVVESVVGGLFGEKFKKPITLALIFVAVFVVVLSFSAGFSMLGKSRKYFFKRR